MGERSPLGREEIKARTGLTDEQLDTIKASGELANLTPLGILRAAHVEVADREANDDVPPEEMTGIEYIRSVVEEDEHLPPAA